MGISDGITRRLLSQCRRPSGWLGGLLAREMNKHHAEVTAWGLSHVGIAGHSAILDIGCGGGAAVCRLATVVTSGKVYGLDYSERSVAAARRTNRELIQKGRVEIRQGSVSSLPFPDDTFTLVTAVETHYFWSDLPSDVREVLRVLRPGGEFVIVAAAYKDENGAHHDRNRRLMELGSMTYLGPDEFRALLLVAGYVDVRVVVEVDRGWICSMGGKPAATTGGGA